jgi:hypothetical protein
MYAAKSQMFNDIYARGAKWQFAGLNIDYYWEARKTRKVTVPRLRCACGRYIKNQYVLRSVADKHVTIKLGITHFEQELGITPQVAREVRQQLNQIQIYMDEVLTYYKWGRRFPQSLYQKAQRLGIVPDSPASGFWGKIADFAVADFPLFHTDQERLTALVSVAGNQAAPKQNVPSTLPERKPNVVVQGHSGAADRAPHKELPPMVVTELAEVLPIKRAIGKLATADREDAQKGVSLLSYAQVTIGRKPLKSIVAPVMAAAERLQGAQNAQLHQHQTQLLTAIKQAVTDVWRLIPVLKRMWQHDAAELQTAPATKAMAQILQLEQKNLAQIRRLHPRQKQVYSESVQKTVAGQFGAFKQEHPAVDAKYALSWQLTLQKIHARCLFDVRSANLS